MLKNKNSGNKEYIIYGGSYSIKKYSSEKKYDPETGEWTHESIILHPLNKDYSPIHIKDEEGFIVIGEFVGTVDK